MEFKLFKQTDGDWGNPVMWGGVWEERAIGCPYSTGGYMRMWGIDAGGPNGMCYIEYKHVSPSGNKKIRKGFRTEEWCNNWIRENDMDVQ
jgi:hypothetical protein